jgi:uncharacterized RDD family membrane protein YckC
MEKTKKIIGVLSRIIAIIILAILSFLNLLTVLLAPLYRATLDVPQIVSVFHKIFNIFFLVVFVYGIYLLIRNNRKYLKMFMYFIPAYYLFMTIYRFFFITHGQFESTEPSNFVILFVPLGLMFVSYKIEPYKAQVAGSNGENLTTQTTLTKEPLSPIQYQGFIVRGIANIIDQILVILPLVAIASLTNTGSNNEEAYMAIGGILFLVYLIVAEAIWGQTLGKRLFGIQVMMQDGRKCTILGAVFRNVFRTIDMIFGGYLLALIVMTVTSRRQRIGDLIAKTVVIKP